MPMDSQNTRNEKAAVKPSKKEISKTLYEKMAGSLAEYELKGKKFESRLKKVSKLFAVDVAKASRKKGKAKTKKEKAEVK